MSFPYVLSLCLYMCAHASGGLILIARQASKCLCYCVYFVCEWNDQQETMCYSAWQLITSLLWLLEFVLVSNICPCIFWPLMCPFLLQDVWLCGEADRQCDRERVSPVCRDGPRAASCGHRQLYQQSHAGTAATQMREQDKTVDCWGSGGDVNMILTRFLFFMKCVSASIYTFACICTGGTTVLGCTTAFITEPGSGRSVLFRAKCCSCVSLQSKQLEGKSSISQRLT